MEQTSRRLRRARRSMPRAGRRHPTPRFRVRAFHDEGVVALLKHGVVHRRRGHVRRSEIHVDPPSFEKCTPRSCASTSTAGPTDVHEFVLYRCFQGGRRKATATWRQSRRSRRRRVCSRVVVAVERRHRRARLCIWMAVRCSRTSAAADGDFPRDVGPRLSAIAGEWTWPSSLPV